MSKNTMITDNNWFTAKDGACDIEFIRANERLVPNSKIHAPISSAEILTKFRERAKNLGLELVNEQGALLKQKEKKGELVGGNRFMYVAEVKDDSHPDYALSVGFRNFGDTTLAFQGMCGNSIFVCKNGVCTSVIKPSRMRHTVSNLAREGFFDSKIDTIFSRFMEDKDDIVGQIEMMKGTALTDNIVGQFVRRANGEWKRNREGNEVFVKNPLLGSANLGRILADLENPAYNSHDDNSVFRLMNACSKVTTHDMKNPSQSAEASRFCNNLIMSIIKPDFRPLGDVVEVEIEEAELA